MNQIILVKTSGIHMRNNPINGMKKNAINEVWLMRRTFWKQRMSNSRNNTNSAIFWLLAKKKIADTIFQIMLACNLLAKYPHFLPICETLETCLAEQLCYYSRNLFIIADFIWVAVDLQRWRWVGFESKEIGSIFSWRKYL